MAQSKELTVQQGLNELKVLDSRIAKAIDNIDVLGVESKDKLIYPSRTKSTVEDFVKKADSEVQSVTDLLNYRKALKSEILKSNGTKKVTIAGKEMTVSEAIEYKNSISFDYLFLRELKKQLANAEIKKARHNETVQKDLDKRIDIAVGKEAKNDQLEFIQQLTDMAEKNKAELVEPNISGKPLQDYISDKEKELEDFEASVDFVLTESNVTTRITVTW